MQIIIIGLSGRIKGEAKIGMLKSKNGRETDRQTDRQTETWRQSERKRQKGHFSKRDLSQSDILSVTDHADNMAVSVVKHKESRTQ